MSTSSIELDRDQLTLFGIAVGALGLTAAFPSFEGQAVALVVGLAVGRAAGLYLEGRRNLSA